MTVTLIRLLGCASRRGRFASVGNTLCSLKTRIPEDRIFRARRCESVLSYSAASLAIDCLSLTATLRHLNPTRSDPKFMRVL